jgi:Uma2 family endonuclease
MVAVMGEHAAIAPEQVRRFTRHEYERMVELGMFADERVELLEGMLVTVSPQGTRHAEVLRRLTRWLGPAASQSSLMLQVQCPLALAADSEPEPDVALVPQANYAHAHPTSASLVVEVADSSRDKDRRVKTHLYAAAGIPEYWLVDLVDDVVEVYREPHEGTYAQVVQRAAGATLCPRALPAVVIPVADLLPAR